MFLLYQIKIFSRYCTKEIIEKLQYPDWKTKRGKIWKKKKKYTTWTCNFFADYEYDVEGNFELGVSFLATMLKKEDIKSKVGSRVDIKYEPQVLPRRLEEESSKRMLLPSSATVSTQWAIFAKKSVF